MDNVKAILTAKRDVYVRRSPNKGPNEVTVVKTGMKVNEFEQKTINNIIWARVGFEVEGLSYTGWTMVAFYDRSELVKPPNLQNGGDKNENYNRYGKEGKQN